MSEAENEVPLEEPEPQTEPEPDDIEDIDEDAKPDEVDGEPEQHTSAQLEDEERSKAFKKIDTSFKTYSAAIERNLGDEVTDWLYCPLCASGAVPGYLNKNDMGRVPAEVEANVKTFLGLAREKDYPASDTHSMCGICQGLGKVSTGSRVPDHATITCHACRGFGYTPPPARSGADEIANGAQPDYSTLTPHDFEQPDRDNWGEPRVLPDGTLNENYGKMPQFKSEHPVFGVTASLTAEELVTGGS